MNGWNWRTKERLPNGELLTPREDVQQDHGRIFTLGFVVALACVIVALLGFWYLSALASRAAHEGHRHGGHKPSQAELEAFKATVAKHESAIKGPYTVEDIRVGSPVHWAAATSFLERGNRIDSRLRARDSFPDGITALAHAWGCGRQWRVADQNGSNPGDGVRETNCNNELHQTGNRNRAGDTSWSPPNYHPN